MHYNFFWKKCVCVCTSSVVQPCEQTLYCEKQLVWALLALEKSHRQVIISHALRLQGEYICDTENSNLGLLQTTRNQTSFYNIERGVSHVLVIRKH